MAATNRNRFVFPRWTNWALPVLIVMVLGGGLYAPTLVTFGFSTYTTDVGYAPVQPVPYSHALHAGELGMDCRYCHSTVDKAGFAAIPPTQTCMNCHTGVRSDSPKIAPLKASWTTGTPVPWVKVHDLPDYAYFNHSAHVNVGVSCVSCHGRVDQMEVVYQAERLSMSWCIDCHRNPEKALRPKDQVTNLKWTVKDLPDTNPELFTELKTKYGTDQITQEMMGKHLKELRKVHDEQYMIACSTCHR